MISRIARFRRRVGKSSFGEFLVGLCGMLWAPVLATRGPLPAAPYVAGALVFLLAWFVRNPCGRWARAHRRWLTLPVVIAVVVGFKMYIEGKPIPEVAPVIVNVYAGFWLGCYFWFFSEPTRELVESD